MGMEWYEELALGMVQGRALAYAEGLGKLERDFIEERIARWAVEALMFVIVRELGAVDRGEKTRFFTDPAMKNARAAFKDRFSSFVNARIEWGVLPEKWAQPLSAHNPSDAEVDRIAQEIETLFRPAIERGENPLSAKDALAALSNANDIILGYGVVTEAMLQEVEELLAGDASAIHISDRRNRTDRDRLRTEAKKSASEIRALPPEKQANWVRATATRIRNTSSNNTQKGEPHA